MVFQKGHTINVGKHHSEETKRKMKLNSPKYWLGKKQSEETIRKKVESRKGYKHSIETKKKISNIHKGKKRLAFSNEWKQKISKTLKGRISPMKGRHQSEEAKRKMSLSIKGCRFSEEHKRKISENHRHYQSEETKKKLKIARSKRIVPKQDTSIEVKIQNFLKTLGIEFFTHQYMNEIEHAYQCDIFIPSKNLVIECDGNYWHKYPTGTETDHIRTSELIEKGFKVLRLWEIEIRKMNLEDFQIKLNMTNND